MTNIQLVINAEALIGPVALIQRRIGCVFQARLVMPVRLADELSRPRQETGSRGWGLSAFEVRSEHSPSDWLMSRFECAEHCKNSWLNSLERAVTADSLRFDAPEELAARH